jgi:threonine aldolase
MFNFIDLRSDTVTKPSKEMILAMSKAEVGDDVYGEDPTVNRLQEYLADLFKKEAAIFVPSGTMSNQIGVKINTNPGDEVIIEKDAHIFFYETAGPAIISNVLMNTIHSENGEICLSEIENAIRPEVYYFPKTSLICLENTHNRHCGSILSLEYLKSVNDFVQLFNQKNNTNIALHLDGARLWNASIASGTNLADYAKQFDTLSVCLSKGLGSPAGSVLLGSKEKINLAKKWRKILGGGMRQVGILAAAGLFAVQNNFERLAEDHENAKYFAKQVDEIEEVRVDLEKVATNMVMIELNQKLNINQKKINLNLFSAAEFVEKCKAKGLLFNATGKNKVRIVFHLDVTKNDAKKAVEIIKSVF